MNKSEMIIKGIEQKFSSMSRQEVLEYLDDMGFQYEAKMKRRMSARSRAMHSNAACKCYSGKIRKMVEARVE